MDWVLEASNADVGMRYEIADCVVAYQKLINFKIYKESKIAFADLIETLEKYAPYLARNEVIRQWKIAVNQCQVSHPCTRYDVQTDRNPIRSFVNKYVGVNMLDGNLSGFEC